MVEDDEEHIPPGPGLPGFAHKISGLGWAFSGLAALVAIARLSVPRSSTAASFRNSEAPDWQ